jgi:hypothetical protein
MEYMQECLLGVAAVIRAVAQLVKACRSSVNKRKRK